MYCQYEEKSAEIISETKRRRLLPLINEYVSEA